MHGMGRSQGHCARMGSGGFVGRPGQGSALRSPAPVPETLDADAGRVTIVRAIRVFTAEFQEYAALNTQKKYRLLLGKLKAFADSKGYMMLDQWGPIDVREFRASWCVSPQTAAKNMSTRQGVL